MGRYSLLDRNDDDETTTTTTTTTTTNSDGFWCSYTYCFRQAILFSSSSYCCYYVIASMNLLLRFAWVLTLVEPKAANGTTASTSSGSSGTDSDVSLLVHITPLLAALEVVRRMVWGFLRLEWETMEVNNKKKLKKMIKDKKGMYNNGSTNNFSDDTEVGIVGDISKETEMKAKSVFDDESTTTTSTDNPKSITNTILTTTTSTDDNNVIVQCISHLQRKTRAAVLGIFYCCSRFWYSDGSVTPASNHQWFSIPQPPSSTLHPLLPSLSYIIHAPILTLWLLLQRIFDFTPPTRTSSDRFIES